MGKIIYALLTTTALALLMWGCSVFPRPDYSNVQLPVPSPGPAGNPFWYITPWLHLLGAVCIVGAVAIAWFKPGSFAGRFPLSLGSFGFCSILLGFGFATMGDHPLLFGVIGVFIILVLAGYALKKKFNLLGDNNDS